MAGLQVPFLDLAAELDRPPVWEALREQLREASFIGGPAVERFEERFQALAGTRYALGLNSGTDAIFLALKALGVGPGDEVVTVSNSFVATAGAIAATGARPVFVDVGPDYQMDPERLAAALGPRTRAVMPVHLTGLPCDMDRILALTRAAGVALIEDAAQAVGARYRGRPVGSFGEAGAFSLHPLKNLNVAGDGGALTTDREDLAERVRRLRNHGLMNRNEAAEFGFNSRLDSIHAAVALVVMERLAEVTARRVANAARYDALLAPLAPRVVIPPRPTHVEQVFHTYVVCCDERDALMAYLAEQGIGTKVHYPIPIHLQPAGRALGYREGDLPVCEEQARRIVSLPVHQHLSTEQLEYVADRVAAFYGR